MMTVKSILAISMLTSALFLGACASEQGPTIKKEIKDVSYQARKEESGPRKRLMILPFLDTNEARPQEMRDAARSEFIADLNKTNEVIVIDSKDLKVDFSKNLQGGEYKLEEMAKAAKDLGVSALLEGKIMDLKVRKKSDEVGVFRQMKTTFEAQVRVRIASSRSGKELFNTVKTVTVEESNVRVAENVNADRFFQGNP